MELIKLCILKTYKIYNPTVRFSKYEFNNKLLGDVTLFRVTPSVTSIVGLHYFCIFSMFAKFQSNQKSIVMSSINCLNSSFCNLK